LKKFLVFVSVILLIILIVAAAAAGIAFKLNEAPEGMPDETVFKVSKGDNAGLVADKLFEQGLISSSSFFRICVRIQNTGGLMKTGLYRISGGSSTLDIHSILLQGSVELFKVAVPPGLTSTDIALILDEAGITSAEDFIAEVEIQNAEGFLFPDTYSFPKEYPADKAVAHMVEVFIETAVSVYPDYAELDRAQLMQRVIMASIIEREYRLAEEASKIASVFYNRIDANMYLGSCATVVYIITEQQGKEHPDKLLYRDLDIESPYNTYRNKGLPPGPICNPGIVAIDAAFNPEETDYLYFLLEDPEAGNHTFSRSLAEHNKSYELYIKGK